MLLSNLILTMNFSSSFILCTQFVYMLFKRKKITFSLFIFIFHWWCCCCRCCYCSGTGINSWTVVINFVHTSIAHLCWPNANVAFGFFFSTQISIRNIVHCLRCIVSGKSFILPSGTWTSDTKKRLCVLFLTTIGLLFARFKVMGSQLPVFTRYVYRHKMHGILCACSCIIIRRILPF